MNNFCYLSLRSSSGFASSSCLSVRETQLRANSCRMQNFKINYHSPITIRDNPYCLHAQAKSQWTRVPRIRRHQDNVAASARPPPSQNPPNRIPLRRVTTTMMNQLAEMTPPPLLMPMLLLLLHLLHPNKNRSPLLLNPRGLTNRAPNLKIMLKPGVCFALVRGPAHPFFTGWMMSWSLHQVSTR